MKRYLKHESKCGGKVHGTTDNTGDDPTSARGSRQDATPVRRLKSIEVLAADKPLYMDSPPYPPFEIHDLQKEDPADKNRRVKHEKMMLEKIK